MRRKTQKTERVDVPEYISSVADQLSRISGKHEELSLGRMSEEDTGSHDAEMAWGNVDDPIFPEDVEEWTNKDLIRWFSLRCNKVSIPFVRMWGRDMPLVKEIRSDLRAAGFSSLGDCRDFIDWSLDHREELKETDGKFNLVTIRRHINDWAQTERAPNDERRSLGVDLYDQMMKEAQKTKKVGHLLSNFGVPLVAALLKAENDVSDEDIEKGFGKAFDFAHEQGREELLRKVAQISISQSPYPEWFPMSNWREVFPKLTEVSRGQRWWQEKDFAGAPFEEYNAFARERK